MGKKIVLRSVKSQADFFLLHHFPHVDEGISHSTQGRVNAYISNISNFLKAESRIMAEDYHLALIIGQLAYKFPDILLDLSFYKMILNICFSKFL